MRFIVDECTGPRVAEWLRAQGHEVYSVYNEAPGMTDDDILSKAHSEDWLLITNDKDFGEKVHREGLPHCGIIFLRLRDERAVAKIRVIKELLDNYSNHIANRFVVVNERQVRFRSE